MFYSILRLRGIGLLCGSVLLFASSLNSLAGTSDLDFEARVRAQRAIEQVYHSHRTGAPKEFDAAVPHEVLEAKVLRFLRQSRALEQHWKRSVTGYMLDRELERMLRDTRDPERLHELFAALGDDPVLIGECLARPILVDRLVRNFYALDDVIHAEARLEAQKLREALLAGRIKPEDDHPRRIVREPLMPDRIEKNVTAADHDQAPAPGEIGRITERPEALVFPVVLVESTDGARVAIYSIPKRNPEEWWNGFEATPVHTVADPDSLHPTRDIVAECEKRGWKTGIESPSPRTNHAALWTGSEMIIFGGAGTTGSRYDPATDTWTAMSISGAPRLHDSFSANWTGSEMIVWGMEEYPTPDDPIGARYDPAADSWTSISTDGAPYGYEGHSAVWTGDEIIVWGGKGEGVTTNEGARYDPVTDSWSPVSTEGAPTARWSHTAVWAGNRMIVWGGRGDLDSGGVYDPATDTWKPTRILGAPQGRSRHTAISTGGVMIVWGGTNYGEPLDSGARYDPASDSWTAVSLIGETPTPRYRHTAIWTGDEMIVWGGDPQSAEDPLGNGGRYDPVSNSWAPVSTQGAPRSRNNGAAVWTGDLMVIWGGYNPVYTDVHWPYNLDTGGRYDPETDSWTPTSRSAIWDSDRQGHSGVWTGSEMIVWGGYGNWNAWDPTNVGLVYNPTTSTQTPTSLTNVPVPREVHTAVWTGAEMIVWGGETESTSTDSGGRYDPVSDTWVATPLTPHTPARRYGHTAIWTGSEMIIWGGRAWESGTGSLYSANGARYSPATNNWIPISLAPPGRTNHTAVWTGTEMIIWGGWAGSDVGELNTGARYDPLTDHWTPIPDRPDTPDAREKHSAVWTGSEMIVWGGVAGSVQFTTGGRYDPWRNTWKPTATLGAPVVNVLHTAIWTGFEMIVWGGDNDSSPPAHEYLEDGSRYNPRHDTWTGLESENVTTSRRGHVAVWTGRTMIVWGGRVGLYEPLSYSLIDAGFYDLPDVDGDGLCVSDCDEFNTNCSTDCTDADADGFCVTTDCDESNSNCTEDCTDADADGYCVTKDCDDSYWSCETECVDEDEDGVWVCAGDCDDTNPNCDWDCTDADVDGYCVTSDCDESNPNCTDDCTDADADGFCVTSDCDESNPNCNLSCSDHDSDGYCEPADCDDTTADCTTDCSDADGDGVRACDGDCDNSNPNCATDCADGDADGYCITTDCDDSVASCTSDCSDWDDDGFRGCDADCDDANPYCTTDCTDADEDGYCVTTDCDEINPHCTSDCTDGDSDGFCVTADCDDADPGCTGSDCSDADDDGMRVCEGDCDDLNPNCAADCTDTDGDGYCVTDDCDESNPNCTSDCTDADTDGYCVVEDCDESNPDCTFDCSDSDSDGLAACEGDCDDTNPAAYPGHEEICTNDEDNDCNGVNDVEDTLCSVLVANQLDFTENDTLVWTSATAADTYGLYRGSIPLEGFAGYNHLCEATALSETSAVDLDTPGLGRGYYYLVAGQTSDAASDSFTGGPLGSPTDGSSRPTSETITCGPRLYVDPDVVLEGGDGLSWASAYSAVSLALDHPAFRDRGAEVWVRGTVTETGVELPQIARPGVRLLGGFAGVEEHSWQRSPETSPTVWSGSGGLLLFQASGSSVVLDGLTMRQALSGFVGAPAGRLTEITNVSMEEISNHGVNLLISQPGESSLFVRDARFDSAGVGAILVVAEAGLLTGEIRDSVFKDSPETALKFEVRPHSSSAEIRLDVVSNVISGGGDGIVLGAHVNDAPGPAIQSSFIGSNLVHGNSGNALSIEATGSFEFEDGPALVDASPLIVGNTLVDNGGDGLACSVERTDVTGVAHLHAVRAAPQVWDNLITHNSGAGISESVDDPDTGLVVDPTVVGNGLHGNSPLYRDEGTTDLTSIEDVNALDGASDNFDEDPYYRNKAIQDYHLAYGTVVGFKSEMRHLANSTDPGLGLLWTQLGFDASAWKRGIYGVGFEIGPAPNALALLKTKVSPASMSVYTRVPFTVDDLSSIHNLILGADYDDGFAVWINGVEVFRSSTLPAGALDWNTPVSLHESSNGQTPVYEEYDISMVGVPVLLEGENLLAVAVWTSASSTDLVLVPRLILQQESPAVDTGHAEAPRTAVEDLDGDPRVNDGDRDGFSRPDVGADERW